MPPTISGVLNPRPILRAWCLLALFLCASATLLAFPHTTRTAAITD